MPKTTLAREMTAIGRAFAILGSSFQRLGPALVQVREEAVKNGRKGAVPPSVSVRRTRKVSPKQRAALKLQGKYMGTMRGLKPAQRKVVKRIRVEKGIQAAISEAVKLAG